MRMMPFVGGRYQHVNFDETCGSICQEEEKRKEKDGICVCLWRAI